MKQRRRVKPEDLLHYQLVSDLQVHPSGASIVFVKRTVAEKPSETESQLWIVPTKRGEA